MGSSEGLHQLDLFCEKVDELAAGDLFRRGEQIGAVVEFRLDKGWDGVFVGPREAAIREAVLTLRLFMQDNDAISLRHIRATLTLLPTQPQLAERFSAQCEALNRYLDSETHLAVEDARQLSHRDILHTFVYGTYAHLNPTHRATFEGIRTTPFFPMFQVYLTDVLLNFRRCLLVLREVAGEAARQLRAAESAV